MQYLQVEACFDIVQIWSGFLQKNCYWIWCDIGLNPRAPPHADATITYDLELRSNYWGARAPPAKKNATAL